MFRNMKEVTLSMIPNLPKPCLPTAFKITEVVAMENAGGFEVNEALIEAKKRMDIVEMESKRSMTVHSRDDWEGIVHSIVEHITVSSNVANVDVMDISLKGFEKLKSIEVGDYCFKDVKRVDISGLSELEEVSFGSHSCIKSGYSDHQGKDNERHFYLIECKMIRRLAIGCKSFGDFSVCEIKDTPRLEVIEIGSLSEESGNFFFASIELKSHPLVFY